MQNMRKWFSGKVSKEDFDKKAREIVTDHHGKIKLIIVSFQLAIS